MSPVGTLSTTASDLFEQVLEEPELFSDQEIDLIKLVQYSDTNMRDLLALQDEVDLQSPVIRVPLTAFLVQKLQSAYF